jgi:energy-coupling factor transporter ATP-binding protein EcfA2
MAMAFDLACGIWKSADWASNELTGQGLKDHAVELIKSIVSEEFTSWFEKKFSKLKKGQTDKVLELVNQLRTFQTSTLGSINPRDLDGNSGLKTQLVDLLRVICEGVAGLSATRDSKGFEQLVARFIAGLNMSLQMFNTAQIQGNASKLDSVYAKLNDTQEEKPPAGARVLFVGNPGSGKSTLLNALVGALLFRSGISDVNLGAGITKYVKWVHHRGVMYGDTPGLNDQTNKVEAAQQIAEGLKAGGVYRLVFLVTIDDRLRPLPSDVATMKITLDAINTPNLEYGIIVNKVRAVQVRKLKGGLMDQLESKLNSHGSHSTTKRVLLYLNDGFLEDQDNALSEAPQSDLFPFLRGLPWQSFGNVDALKMAKCVPSFLPSCLPSLLRSFLPYLLHPPACLPSLLPSFVSSFLPSFIPFILSFLPSFASCLPFFPSVLSFLCYFPSVLSFRSFLPFFLPVYLPAFLPSRLPLSFLCFLPSFLYPSMPYFYISLPSVHYLPPFLPFPSFLPSLPSFLLLLSLLFLSFPFLNLPPPSFPPSFKVPETRPGNGK